MNRGSTRVAAMLLAWLALLMSGAATARSARPGLPSGPAMVVIAPARPSAAELESEAYGDWAHYLNAFVTDKPPALTVRRMTVRDWRRVARAPALTQAYGAVFVRRDGRVLIYRGRVLEPDVYLAGSAWALGRGAPASADWGLVEARLVRR